MQTLTSIIMEQQAIIAQRAEKMTLKQMKQEQQEEIQEVIAGNREILKKLKNKELQYKKGYVKTFRFLDMLDILQSAKLLFGHIEKRMWHIFLAMIPRKLNDVFIRSVFSANSHLARDL